MRDSAAIARSLSHMTSAPSIIVPFGGPLRGEIFAHVERSRHRVAVDRAGEAEAQGVAVPLGIRTGDLHRAAFDRSLQIARDEVALVRSLEAIAGLLQVQRMHRCAC